MKQRLMKQIRAIDLFCGAGGSIWESKCMEILQGATWPSIELEQEFISSPQVYRSTSAYESFGMENLASLVVQVSIRRMIA